MPVKLGIVMDPIAAINPVKDSSLAMLLAAQRRGWSLYYMQTTGLFLRQNRAWGRMQAVKVSDSPTDWYRLEPVLSQPLAELDVLLMRKDPPFDLDYLYATYLLEQAEFEGCRVINKPSALRDANEKLYTGWFPELTPETLVTANLDLLREFLTQQGDIIVKPLDSMGGASVFRVSGGDPNSNVIFETMTRLGQRMIMAQRYIPEIRAGDKRILLIDGEPIPYALARIPQAGETRGNLAAGGRGVSQPLSESDLRICRQVAPRLRERGLVFVGLDVIGNYLTEINVTSPTCIRELDKANDLDIAGQLMDIIQQQLDTA